MNLFIDASVFCAFINEDDVHHKKSKKILGDLIQNKLTPITTDYIFDETLTVILRRVNKEKATEIGRYLLDSEISIAPIDVVLFEKTWDEFQKQNEKFSFTDCSNIAFMKLFGITKIATFDKAFKNVQGIEVIDG